jgi:hypothetical protein
MKDRFFKGSTPEIIINTLEKWGQYDHTWEVAALNKTKHFKCKNTIRWEEWEVLVVEVNYNNSISRDLRTTYNSISKDVVISII